MVCELSFIRRERSNALNRVSSALVSAFELICLLETAGIIRYACWKLIMAADFEFRLNGRQVRVADCSPNLTLLEYLREAGLTGAKEGCAEGDCGACSVTIIDRDSEGRTCYRAINSCLVPLCLLAGREIVSVEGVRCNHDLHP